MDLNRAIELRTLYDTGRAALACPPSDPGICARAVEAGLSAWEAGDEATAAAQFRAAIGIRASP